MKEISSVKETVFRWGGGKQCLFEPKYLDNVYRKSTLIFPIYSYLCT